MRDNQIPDENISLPAFVKDLDLRLGSLPLNKTEALMERFSSKVQPWLVRLLRAVAEGHGVEWEQIPECLFLLYAFHRYHVEKLHQTLPPLTKQEVEKNIRRIEKLCLQYPLADWEQGFREARPDLMAGSWQREFVTIWRQNLVELAEDGSIHAAAGQDLDRFGLVVLQSYLPARPSS